MKIKTKSAIAAAMAVTVGAVAPAQAEDVRLKLSHFFPTSIQLHTDFVQVWIDELAQCTGGEVTTEVHAAGSALGDANRQFDQARAGVVDIAVGHTGFPRGRFPRSSLIELPFLAKSGTANSFALWNIAETYLKPEYQGVHLLGMMAHNPGIIHTSVKIETLEDIKGLRLRTPNATTSALLEHFGAEPIGLPPGDIYENLQKGTLDGIAMDWTGVASYKLNEVLNYHLEVPLFTVGFYIVMNQRTYDGLSDAHRACVDQVSGDRIAQLAGATWENTAQVGYDSEVNNPGDVIIVPTDEQIAAWRAELAPVYETLLEGARKAGVEDPGAIVNALEAEIAKYE